MFIKILYCLAVLLGLSLLPPCRAYSASDEASAFVEALADESADEWADAGWDSEMDAPPDMFERPMLWFPVGECLTYKIRWGPFTVGTTRVVSEWIREDGRDLVAIRATTRSTPFFDRIYHIDDFLESIVDPDTFIPLRFTKRLNEGSSSIHEITTFDHESGMACWTQLLKDVRKEFAIEPDTRDLLSFMFYIRSRKFEPEKKYHFRVMADDKIYDLDVVSGTHKTIKLPNFGRIRSLRLDPEANFQGLFVRVGKVRVWVSDDDRFLCTQAAVGIPLGTVKAILVKVEGPGYDFWSLAGEDRD